MFSSIVPVLAGYHDYLVESKVWNTYIGFAIHALATLVLVASIGHVEKVFKMYLLRQPKIPVAGPATILGHWYTSIWEHMTSNSILLRAYHETSGGPFAVPSLNRYKVLVSSSQHLKEINDAPIDQLSFNAAIDEQFIPHIIFNGFEFNPKDPRNIVPLHAMQVNLRDNLPALLPKLLARTMELFEDDSLVLTPGRSRNIYAPAIVQRMVETLNNMVLCGEELSRDEDFLRSSMHYTRDVKITGEVLRFTPSILVEPVGRLCMNITGAKNIVDARLQSLLRSRIENPSTSTDKPADLIQWMTDSSRKKTPQAIARLSQHAMGLLFGGAHQAPILLSFALYNLCKYPEYVKPLRQEIEAAGTDTAPWFGLPLMDSFLKETARLQPSVAMTMPRKVMKPFTFSDGTHIPVSNWICVPSLALMRDEAHYRDPLHFEGFRFAELDGSKFTTPSDSFVFWGGTKRPCPGRFYVSAIVKMILAQFLTRFDMELADPNASQSISWSFAVVPHPLTKIVLRQRKHDDE